MKVTEVSRTISGGDYDNISATAKIEDGDSITSVAKKLDTELRETLEKIQKDETERHAKESQKSDFVYKLRNLIDSVERDDLPF